MAFPYEPSDFRSNQQLATYFFLGDEVWQTDGFSLLLEITSQVAELLTSNALRDPQGMAITITDVPAGATLSWDTQMLRLIYAAAAALRVEQAWLDQIASDISANAVSVGTVQTGIWLAYVQKVDVRQDGRIRTQYGTGTPAQVRVAENSVLPVFGAQIAMGPAVGSLTKARVPQNLQPPAMPPAQRAGVGSAAVAIGFFSVVAIAGIVLISRVPTVTHKPQKARKNPSKRRKNKRSTKRKGKAKKKGW